VATPAEKKLKWYPGIGFRKGTALSQVEKRWSEKAAELLAPYKSHGQMVRPPSGEPRCILLGPERADDLQIRLCEALVAAYEEGYAVGGTPPEDFDPRWPGET